MTLEQPNAFSSPAPAGVAARMPSRKAFLGLDIGGTRIKAVLVDQTGRVLDDVTYPTRGMGAAIDSLVHTLDLVVERSMENDLTLCGIGAAAPGIVNHRTGVVVTATNLEWTNVPLARILEDRFNVPAVIDHDARVAATAEWAHRKEGGRPVASGAFIPIGTGVAAAVTVQGTLVRGSGFAAGEFGHVVIYPDGEPCPCGADGCLETYASASAIARRFRARSGRSLTAEQVGAALPTDAIARAVWSEAIDALAIGIANLASLLDPELIVIGGGLSRAGDALLNPLVDRLDDTLPWRQRPQVELSEIGERAGRLGAARLALTRNGFERFAPFSGGS